ncbi:outer membrane beta-barrel protein [Winogradskyella immobilis]|uniref:Outer membrane protein beta-barrel domain-containing protein n=1 Tax=Winogradskyella immobilis TaxID=2816852 RepID=A0ABS8EP12_9FLAO|nr:outer membrane beta-barrel protein [Winogradskyella immobilis]MCC1484951.1 hypothetical protein [Winogradskyella immobilis]MCG0017043.1 outer membrane beta-barrel protein [Winogradskyella immobilis]
MKKKTTNLILLVVVFISALSFAQEQNINISGNQTSVKVLSSGTINFYKTASTNTHYIENTKLQTGIVELKKLGEPHTVNKNRGKLIVIFNDCVSIRTKASKSDMTEARVIQLINDYNNCSEYTDSFELSERQKIDQTYANQKSVLNYDFGIGYHNQTTDIRINNQGEQSEDDGSLSLFASLNISPAHLGSLTGRLFYDFTLQYNFNTSFEFTNVEQDLSSLQITITPKYYFNKPESKLNPFIGAGLGAVILDYEITDITQVTFDTIDSSRTKFIYGFEIGAEFLSDFEFTLAYYPDYKNDIVIDEDNIIRSDFQNLSFKLGYKF